MYRSEEGDSYAFVVEWYDPAATIIRRYVLTFHTSDNSVEMYDPKNHRLFLRRAKADNLRVCDLYIGNSVNILGRQLTFIAYGDEPTRRRLGVKNERTLGLIMPDAADQVGEILDAIWKSGLQIANLKSVFISRDEASEFYSHHQAQQSFTRQVDYMSSGLIIALEIKGENSVRRWLELIGGSSGSLPNNGAGGSLAARFSKGSAQASLYGSESCDAAARELEFFFPLSGPKRQNTACFNDSTCCLIKPHIVQCGQAGEILMKIQETGFQVSALLMVNLDKANAEEFLEVYKGVVQEYPLMVTELCSGPSLVLEVRAQDAPLVFREFVGPADPEIARHLRPGTLRALYGKNKSQNAVHCTDLPEDSLLEVEYFFKILDR